MVRNETARKDPIDALAEAMRELQRLRASRKVHAAVTDAADVDLPQQAVQVLVALDGTLPVARLAGVARMDVGAVSRQLRVLQGTGLVTKAPSPDHARVVLVTATAAGRAAAARITASRNDHLARAVAEWSDGDLRALGRLLHRLVDDLQRTPYTGDVPRPVGGSR